MIYRKPLLALLSLTLFASVAFGELSPDLKAWGEGPAHYLMTSQEANQWKAIKTDDEAKKFIALFWARRDPDLKTPGNAFRDRFDALVKFADEKYGYHGTAGSMTDRGKVLILLGPPYRVARTGAENISNIQSGFSSDANTGALADDRAPTETWYYEKERIPEFLGKRDAQFAFVDRYASGDFKLGRVPKTVPEEVFKKAVDASVVNPGLKEPPTGAAQQTPPATATAAAPEVAKEFKTDTFRVAVEEYKAGKENPYKKSFVTYGEFVTPKGDYFVPVQIYLPEGTDLGASDLTFFAVIQDKDGNPVAVFEEPAQLKTSKYNTYFDRTVLIPSGKYTGYFGLASAGKPVTLAKADMDLAPLNSSETGTSRLMISNDIYPLAEAQKAEDPFAFGGIKVVPKGDRSFKNSDELWYFFELRNPGLDDAGNPKIQSKVDVEGTTSDKKKIKMSAPMAPVQAEPLKGVEGHYGVGSSIPLASFKPGDYTLKVTVNDVIKQKTYVMQQDFRVAGN